jgi:hypothetical protein
MIHSYVVLGSRDYTDSHLRDLSEEQDDANGSSHGDDRAKTAETVVGDRKGIEGEEKVIPRVEGNQWIIMYAELR